jgi:hypothetical protein
MYNRRIIDVKNGQRGGGEFGELTSKHILDLIRELLDIHRGVSPIKQPIHVLELVREEAA